MRSQLPDIHEAVDDGAIDEEKKKLQNPFLFSK
jgi:hypothetical protein